MMKIVGLLMALAAGAAQAQPSTPLCAFPNDNGCFGLAGLQRSVAFRVGANGAVATVPQNAILRAIYIQNTTANAVTGGINIGTTSGGSDVVLAFAVGANGLLVVDGATLLKKYMSSTQDQLLFISAVTAWNSAVLNIRFQFDQ